MLCGGRRSSRAPRPRTRCFHAGCCRWPRPPWQPRPRWPTRPRAVGQPGSPEPRQPGRDAAWPAPRQICDGWGSTPQDCLKTGMQTSPSKNWFQHRCSASYSPIPRLWYHRETIASKAKWHQHSHEDLMRSRQRARWRNPRPRDKCSPFHTTSPNLFVFYSLPLFPMWPSSWPEHDQSKSCFWHGLAEIKGREEWQWPLSERPPKV